MPDAALLARIAVLEAQRREDLRARKIAREEVNRRLDDMNELREQINRERGAYLRDDEYERRHEALSGEVASSTREAASALRAYKESQDQRIKTIEATVSVLSGQRRGSSNTLTLVFAGLAVLVAFAFLIASVLTHGFS